MLKSVLSTIAFLCLVSGIYIIFGSGTNSVSTMGPKPVQQSITQAYLPYTLDFAGEQVPMQQQDIKERLDRELTSITYRHSSTIRIMKLAHRWMPVIEEILRVNGVPDDFKYLAMAESGLENATSPKGAVGFWQFLSETGRNYGLEVSSDVDERRHVEKATLAACKYLKKEREKFGSWTMSAAAYNRGPSGMKTNITEQGSNNYYDLYLNTETYRYIFRILAYKVLMQNPEQYGFYFSSNDLYPPVPHRTIEVESISDIATFARQYGTNYKHIKLLNPWLRKKYLKAKKGKKYSIKIPL